MRAQRDKTPSSTQKKHPFFKNKNYLSFFFFKNEQSELNANCLRSARAGNLEKVLEYLGQSIDINVSNSVGHI
jgi:hypothetical protein